MAAHPLSVERRAVLTRAADSTDDARGLARRLTPRRFVAVWAVVVGALLVSGSLQASGLIDPVAMLDPNGERNIPAAVSALALLMAAVLTASVVRTSTATRGRAAGWCLSAVLAFMAVDEFGEIHERLERITGIDWQVLYLPLMAIAGVAALGALVHVIPSPRARLIFLLGAACWAVSNLFEVLEYDANDQRVAGYDLMVLVEENLERIGSILFGLAMLVTLAAATRVARRTPDPGSRPDVARSSRPGRPPNDQRSVRRRSAPSRARAVR